MGGGRVEPLPLITLAIVSTIHDLSKTLDTTLFVRLYLMFRSLLEIIYRLLNEWEWGKWCVSPHSTALFYHHLESMDFQCGH